MKSFFSTDDDRWCCRVIDIHHLGLFRTWYAVCFAKLLSWFNFSWRLLGVADKTARSSAKSLSSKCENNVHWIPRGRFKVVYASPSQRLLVKKDWIQSCRTPDFRDDTAFEVFIKLPYGGNNVRWWSVCPHDLAKTVTVSIFECKGGAVVRALASHRCGPGSNPGVDAICGLSLLLVLSLAPRGFCPVFPFPQKPTLPNSNSIWKARTRLNEFIWTLKCFLGKKAIYNFFYKVREVDKELCLNM